jgi:uncharacterized membrane protein (TIGR02234 family)
VNRSRSVALALAFQALALLSLSQDWFLISMKVDGAFVELGSYNGASAYPVASPLALLSLAALSIVAISTGMTQRVAIAITAISPIMALAIVLPLAISNDVSALDAQLDRLTGIANTHGLQDLGIEQTAMIAIWTLLTTLAAIFGVWMLFLASSWQNLDRGVTIKKQRASKARPKTSIDLWDEQR